VLASFRGELDCGDLPRARHLEALLRRWRDQMGEAGMERYAAGQDRSLAERPVVLRAAARGSARIRCGCGKLASLPPRTPMTCPGAGRLAWLMTLAIFRQIGAVDRARK
jgi:hypothetical protein